MNSKQKLFDIIKSQYKLDINKGYHGVTHWNRVAKIGSELAKMTGANPEVVDYFSLLHDCCRENEDKEPEHGYNAVVFCIKNKSLIELADKDFGRLMVAIGGHPGGMISKDMTIATCWDADRLDLGRVGQIPDKLYLSTRQASIPDFYEWATKLHQRGKK